MYSQFINFVTFYLCWSFQKVKGVQQSVMYQYRELPVPWFVYFFWWYRNKLVPEKVSESVSGGFCPGKKSWNRYRKNLAPEKVLEPVSEKFDTRTESRCQNLGILKIYNGYHYRIGTGTGIFFWWYRNKYWKNLVSEKSLVTGIGKKNYRKTVSKPVSENLLPEIVPVSEIFGTWS